jgi:hypothetical protein
MKKVLILVIIVVGVIVYAKFQGSNEGAGGNQSSSVTRHVTGHNNQPTLEGKYAFDQFKLTNGNGVAITEEKEFVDQNSEEIRIKTYGQANPFKFCFRQRGSFNGVPIIVSFFELKGSAQVAPVLQHMDAFYKSYEQSTPTGYHDNSKRISRGNFIISIHPKDNDAFVKFILDKITQTTH